MGIFKKYFSTVLALLFTLLQPLHTLSHTFSVSHNADYTLKHDHKDYKKQECKICQYDLVKSIDENPSIEYSIINFALVKIEKVEYISKFYEHKVFFSKTQRPPPSFIS